MNAPLHKEMPSGALNDAKALQTAAVARVTVGLL